jgi:hypothetical protein
MATGRHTRINPSIDGLDVKAWLAPILTFMSATGLAGIANSYRTALIANALHLGQLNAKY